MSREEAIARIKDRIEVLKPCPFCGGEARLEHYYDTDGYLPMCSTDGCFGMIEKWFDTKEEAIEAWNRREGEQDG